MLNQQFRLFLRSITLININPGLEFFLWIISSLQHAAAIVSFIFRFYDSMSIPNISTLVNYITLDCFQHELYHNFPFFFTLSVIHSFLLLILVILFWGWYKLVLNVSKIRDFTRLLAAYHNSLLYIMSSSVLSLYLYFYDSDSIPKGWNLSKSNANSLVPIAIICLCFNVIFMVATSLFTFNPAFGTLTSRRASLIDIFRMISKSVLMLYNILAIPLGKSAGWVVGLIVLISEIVMIYLLTSDCPFYNEISTKTQAFFSSVNFTLLIVHFIYMGVDPKNISPLLIWISFCGMAYSLLRYKLNIKPGELAYDKYDIPTQAKSFRKLSKIAIILKEANISLTNLKSGNSINMVILKGLIAEHRLSCKVQKCFCKIYDDERIAVNKTDLENSFNKFTENVLKEFWKENITENPNNNAWLKLTFAELIIKYNITQFPLAITYINSINSSQSSIHLTLETERLIRYIKNHVKKLVSKDTLDVNMIKFLDYKQAASKLKRDIIENTDTIEKFWNEYQENIPTLLKLYKSASKANKFDQSISESWSSLKKKFNSLLVEDHLFFAAYCLLVKNKEIEGGETIKEYQTKIHQFLIQTRNVEKVTQQTIIEKSNIIVTMNMNKSKLGKMAEIKGNSSALGFSPTELKDAKVNVLIPPYVSIHHDQYLHSHLEFGKYKMLNSNVNSHALHKLGHIIPIYLYIAPSPNVEKSFHYIGIIRPIPKYEEYVILSRDTTILGYTQIIGGLFGLKAENLNKTKLTQFCSILKLLNRFLETYDWIQVNLTEQEKIHYTIVKKKLDEYLLNNPNDFELLQVPENEKEYEYMFEIKEKFDKDGWPLDFMTTDRVKKFSCTSKVDAYFTTMKVRKFTMRLIDIKSSNSIRKQSKKYSVKRVSTIPKAGRLFPETVDPSFQQSSDRIGLTQSNMDLSQCSNDEENSQDQFDRDPNPSSKIGQQKANITFLSEKRVDSFEETFQNASFPEEITENSPEKRRDALNKTIQIEISMIKSQNNKSLGGELEKTRGVSFMDNLSVKSYQNNNDASSETSNQDRYHRKKTPRLSTFVESMRNKIYITKEATRSIENLGSFSDDILSLQRQDKQEAYMNLIHQSRLNGKIAKSVTSSVSPGNYNSAVSKRMERAINSPIKDGQMAMLGTMILIFYVGLISALFAFNFYSRKNLSDISYILTGLRASSNRLNTLLLYNYHVKKIDLINDDLLTELYPGYIEDQLTYRLEKIREFVDSIEEYNPPIYKTYSVVHEDDVIDLMEPCKINPAIEDEEVFYVTLDKAIAIFETDSAIIFEKDGEADKEVDTVLVNVLDDVLIRSESVPATYLDHLGQLIEYIQEYLRYFVICQGVFTGLLVCYIFHIELGQIRFRNRFFEALIKIESSKYKNHVEYIKDFKALAEEKLVLGRESEIQTKIKKNKNDGHHEKYIRRKYNSSRIHLVSVFRLILQTAILIVMLTASGVVLNIVLSQTSNIRTSCANLIDVTYMQEKMVLVISAIDNYLTKEPSNTIRNKPVDNVVWEELNYINDNQRFYIKATVTSEPDPKIMAVAQSDMCRRYKGQYDESLDCYQIADSSLKYGISAMYSYVIEYVRGILTAFDETNQEEVDIKNILKSPEYRSLATVLENFVMLPHTEMLNIIEEHNTTYSENNNTFIWVTNVVYLLVACLFAFISISINKKISQEKLETKKMLNLIPVHTILETPMLAIYVEKDNRVRF